MKGKLFVIGIGPGDPELMTLKAARLLKETEIICVPKGRKGGESLALSIAEKAVGLNDKKIIEIHFPMTKGPQKDALREPAKEILGILNSGADIAFITLGDPTLYSTFFHLYDALTEQDPLVNVEIIPGVSSVTAASARAGISLGLSDEKIAILPATYAKDIDKALNEFDTVILMKVHSVIEDVKKAVASAGLMNRAVYVSRAGMEDEIIKPLAEVGSEDLNYFSTVIIRRRVE